MRDCVNGEMRDRLPDLLHGHLPAAERAVVLAHVNGCADCSAELELLRGLRSAMAPTPAVDVSRIVAALPPAPGSARPALVRDDAVVSLASRRRSRLGQGWRVAAAIGTLMVGGTSLGLLARHRSESTPAPVTVASSGAAATGASRDAGADASGSTPTPATVANGGANVPATSEAEMASGALLADATDAELESLIQAIEQFDGTPAVEPEPVSPLVTTSGTGGM